MDHRKLSYTFALIAIIGLSIIGIVGPILIPFSWIPWEPNFIDLGSVGAVPPGTNNHILGTDTLGRDVLSGLIHGTRFSLIVAFLSTSIALLIALTLSIFTTYIGNHRLKINLIQCLFISLTTGTAWFILFRSFPINTGVLILIKGVLLFGILISSYFLSKSWFTFSSLKSIDIPMDLMGLKFNELFYAIPSLLLLLFLTGLTSKNGIFQISIILGSLMWTIFYRYLRLEIIREKSKDHFTALQNLGYSDGRIVWVHFLPKILSAISTPMIFAFISAILLEATLSFLGIGIDPDIVTWGKLLAQARIRIDAWWLAIFPGLFIFITVLSLNVLAKEKIE